MVTSFDRLQELDKLWRETKPEAFDVSPNGMWRDEINPEIANMGAAVIDDMEYWRKRQRGIWLVTGSVGSGKSALITTNAFKGKYYFGRTPILDYKPTALFGYYQYFTQHTFVQMLEQLNGIVKGEIAEEIKKTKGGEKPSSLLEQATEEWLNENGETYFQHSVICLDEYKRYFDKRRPHNPMGLLLSDINVQWRHYDTWIMGATTDKSYLDFRAFKELTLEARCVSIGNGQTIVGLHSIKRVSQRGVLEIDDKPEYYWFNLFTPREILGGKSYSKIYNTTNLFSMRVPKSLKREG